MFINIQIRGDGVPTAPYWFPVQSTLGAISDAWLSGKIVFPLTINLVSGDTDCYCNRP